MKCIPECFVVCRYKATQLSKLKGLIAHGRALRARHEELIAIMPAASSVGEWSAHDVGEWAERTAGLEAIQEAVAASGIDGTTLLCLDPSDDSSASRLGLPSPFVFKHLCVHRDELLATLAPSAPTPSSVDSITVEALHVRRRGFRESFYELVRPRRRFHLPTSPPRVQWATAGEYELGAAVLAPRDRRAVTTGVC
jgi:hypothetical protein